DAPSRKIYCLDGETRIEVLRELEQEGSIVPEHLPAYFVDAESEKEASELVLLYSSFYSNLKEENLLDFTRMFDIDLMELSMQIEIPNIDIEHLLKIPDLDSVNKEIDTDSFLDLMEMKFAFNREIFIKVQN